eukprot:jgi/Chlat1/6541/Chrsp45S06008
MAGLLVTQGVALVAGQRPCASSYAVRSARPQLLLRPAGRQTEPRPCHSIRSNRRRLRRLACCSAETNEEASTTSQQELPSVPTDVFATPQKDAPQGPQPLYGLLTGLALAGCAETAYLTYAKLFLGGVSCPTSGCDLVLNSEYSELLGIPLSLFGAAAYAAVAVLAQLAKRDRLQGAARWLLLGVTSAMATASVYLVYVILFKLQSECPYCFASATISLALCVASLRSFTGRELKQAAAPEAALCASVVLALTVAFGNVDVAGARVNELPYSEPTITTQSTPWTIALAQHLRTVGAKFYGAFWCNHCHDQKEDFGQEAMKYVNYVECYPNGFRRGENMAKACLDAKLEGFPTWIINGQVLSGEQQLSALAEVSGFQLKAPELAGSR